MTAPDSQVAAQECRSFATSTRIEAAYVTAMSMEALPHLLLTSGRSVSKLTDQFMLCDGRAWTARKKWIGDYAPGLIATVLRTWHRRDRSRPMHMAMIAPRGIVSEVACDNLRDADRTLRIDGEESLSVRLERSSLLGVLQRYIVCNPQGQTVYSMPLIDHSTRVRLEENGQWLLTGQAQRRDNALDILIVLARVLSLGRWFPGHPARTYGLISQVGPLQLSLPQQWQIITLLTMMRVTEFHRDPDDG